MVASYCKYRRDIAEMWIENVVGGMDHVPAQPNHCTLIHAACNNVDKTCKLAIQKAREANSFRRMSR